MSTNDKWDKVLKLLSELYELYYSDLDEDRLLLKVKELMEAYNEWLD